MDAVDFQEKMDQNHREIFCRMLGVKELPERLLEQYLQVKMMTDRIDGFLNAGNLAIIAIMVRTVDESVEQPVERVDEQPVERPSEKKPTIAELEKLIGTPDEVDIMPDGSTRPKYPPKPPVKQPAPDKKETFWSAGMPVKVLHDEEFKQGKIVGIISPGKDTDKAIQLTVKFEDSTTVTVNENEVEAD